MENRKESKVMKRYHVAGVLAALLTTSLPLLWRASSVGGVERAMQTCGDQSPFHSRNAAQGRTAAILYAATTKPHAELRTSPAVVNAGRPATLIFQVKDAQGAPIRSLRIVHEKPMHLLIVSSDLAEFYHIHPELHADGSYRVTQTFPNGGAYKLFADFTPAGSSQIVERMELQVAGERRQAQPLIAPPELVVSTGGVRVAMSTQEPLCAGEELTVGFKVTDDKTGAPVNDLQPYLGEFAHFVIISEDLKNFLHAHPFTSERPADASPLGRHRRSMRAFHEHGKRTTNAKASPSEVFAHTTFPKSGLFKIWAQFKRRGQIIISPFIVNVPSSHCLAATANRDNGSNEPAKSTFLEPSPDIIKVTVSGEGYTPSLITVKKGTATKLAFYRADAENCGGVVVFPTFKIRQKLPVGESVLVELPPQEAGKIEFTCGMGMLKGSIVVR
jgi:hypothetical protein